MASTKLFFRKKVSTKALYLANGHGGGDVLVVGLAMMSVSAAAASVTRMMAAIWSGSSL
jgi:hypothetical protein